MKKTVLFLILSVLGFCNLCAEDHIKGIIATYDGAETSYKLEEFPTVKYLDIEDTHYAALYLNKQTEPSLIVPLAEGKKLVITYGEYTPEEVDGITSTKASITERQGKKYIKGGKLVIVAKDGRKYDVKGEELK
ncbi:MAG: hypothetical protein MJZ73_12240 [Bacteroidaceae bacterium]|nr:hypothetical protein [Bacteroidaceae bacterium]